MSGNCSEPLAIDKEQGFRFVSRLSSLTTFDSDKATRGRAARHIVNRKAIDAENFPAENFLKMPRSEDIANRRAVYCAPSVFAYGEASSPYAGEPF